MTRKRYAEDLTIDELRRLLIEKRRTEHAARLDHFRRTGRVLSSPSPLTTHKKVEVDPLEVDGTNGSTLPRKPLRRSWVDRMLLLVEILAVLGLLVILFNGVSLLRNLNREVAVALVQPTLTPTPLIVAVVLPSGHTPPNSPGGGQPNTAEIPEHLQPLVQSLANLPLPTPGPEQAVRIQIPALGVDAPVIQGDGWEQLKKGVGQSLGTTNPGAEGNVVLSAHNDIYGEIFRDLDRLRPGDQVILFTSQRTFTYIVRQSQVVEPSQVEVMAQTQQSTLTLISCYPYLVDNKRIVVTADLQE